MDYETRKQLKEEEKSHRATKQAFIKTIKIILPIALVVVGGVWAWRAIPASETLQENSSGIIAQNGIHWHTNLSIVIKGEKQEIPKDIGIGAIHQPVHTHETDGVIHLEFSNLVREQDIRLGKFFENWGKRFTRECIVEYCNSAEGSVVMTVNGTPSTDFENYLMQDGDNIEIRFE